MNEKTLYNHSNLTEDFKLGPNYRTTYRTTLTKNCIVYEAKSTETSVNKISLDDVTGARVSYTTADIERNLAFIHIYSYPLKKKKFTKCLRRSREEHVFCVGNSEDLNENKAIAEMWVKSIRWLLTSDDIDQLGQDFPPRKQFLVIVNPFGGKGNALKLFNTKVKPMLDEADVDYELKVTEYAGHAKEIAQNVDVIKLNAILFCSGDGLIHEVVNGLMGRPDWKRAIQTPIGHIPCGSGNGLCATALYHSGVPFHITSAIFSILRGHAVPLDIVKMQTANSEVHYSFLGVVLGIVAEIDVDSEKYRYIGDVRFTLMGFKKIMNPTRFTGKIWYLPLQDQSSSSQDEEKTHQSGGDNSVYSASDQEQPMENGVCESVISNVYLPNKLEDPLPDTWKLIEGTFVGWSFISISHIGKNVHMAPGAQLGGGVIYGFYLSGDISRKNLLDVFGKVDKGEHINVEGLHMIKAHAFRLESYATSSKIICIDGEQVHFGTVQGEIYKGLGRVICRQIPDV